MKKITVRKLAELAGVSRGTVDKVLHDRVGVSDEVRSRVQAVIEEQEYHLPERKRGADTSERADPIHVAVIIPRLHNEFFRKAKQGMDDVFRLYKTPNVTADYFYCSSENVSEMLSVLEYIREKRVDGIILRGSQSRRLCEALDAFSDADTPVVLFDSDVVGCKRLCFVGEDSKASGRIAASLLAKCIGQRGEIAVIGGMSEISGHRLRIQSFQQAIAERFPEIRIVDIINSYDQGVIAYEKTIQLVTQYQNLRGIFCAVGCTADIGQALLDKKKPIKIVSYNTTPDVVDLVRRGIVEFTLELAPYQQGAAAASVMLDFLCKGNRPETAFLEIPARIVLDENIDAILAKGAM